MDTTTTIITPAQLVQIGHDILLCSRRRVCEAIHVITYGSWQDGPLRQMVG